MVNGHGVRSFPIKYCIRGYHVYQRIWNAELSEVAVAVCKYHNHHVAIDHTQVCSASVSSSQHVQTF